MKKKEDAKTHCERRSKETGIPIDAFVRFFIVSHPMYLRDDMQNSTIAKAYPEIIAQVKNAVHERDLAEVYKEISEVYYSYKGRINS